MSNPFPLLRKVALAEGWSWLVLLLIAMPMKYWGGMPLAVSIAGSIHGALFVAFLLAWTRTQQRGALSPKRSWLVFLAALVPFAPFVVDRHLVAWESEYQKRAQ